MYKVSNVLGFLVEGLGRRMLCFVVVSSDASFNVLWHGNGNGQGDGNSIHVSCLVSDSANPHYMSDPLPQSFVGSL